MQIKHDCLHCGAEFMGRPNKKYCSQFCKDSERARRRRINHLKIEIFHYEKEMGIAGLRSDSLLARYHGWHSRQLRTELEAIEKEVESVERRVEQSGTCAFVISSKSV